MADRLVSPIAFKPMYHQLKALDRGNSSRAIKVLELAGIQEAQLSQIIPSISYKKYYQAWQLCESLSGDPLFGLHIGERMHPSSLGVVGYAIMNCDNIFDALRLTIQVNPYQNETVRNDVRNEGGIITIELNSTYPCELVRPWVEMCICAYQTLFHLITNNQYHGPEASPEYSYLEVGFKHQLAGSVEEYERVLGCKVKFNQKTSYAAISAEVGDLPVYMSDPKMLNKLLSELKVKSLRAQSTSDAVRNHLAGNLSEGAPNQSQMAKALGLSRSTLTRRLKAEGQTFGNLYENLQKEIAMDLLKNSKLPISEIGLQVGFSNASAFFRAFKSWLGMTPGEYRERS